MKCHVKEGGDLMEFNWKFYKKENQDDIPDEVPSESDMAFADSNYLGGNHYHYGWRAIFPVIIMAIILAAIFYLVQRRHQLFNGSTAQVFYNHDNANFVTQPVFGAPPPPQPPAPVHVNNNDPWKMVFTAWMILLSQIKILYVIWLPRIFYHDTFWIWGDSCLSWYVNYIALYRPIHKKRYSTDGGFELLLHLPVIVIVLHSLTAVVDDSMLTLS